MNGKFNRQQRNVCKHQYMDNTLANMNKMHWEQRSEYKNSWIIKSISEKVEFEARFESVNTRHSSKAMVRELQTEGQDSKG